MNIENKYERTEGHAANLRTRKVCRHGGLAEHEVENTSRPDIEVGISVQRRLHVLFVKLPIHLCSWTLWAQILVLSNHAVGWTTVYPNSRTLRSVQYLELNACLV